MERVRSHVLVSGRVQGVGYRAATYKMAIHLQLNGWVRNLADGRVEAVFEGDRETVEAMLQWCWQGSPLAIVQAVATVSEVPEGIAGFQIKR